MRIQFKPPSDPRLQATQRPTVAEPTRYLGKLETRILFVKGFYEGLEYAISSNEELAKIDSTTRKKLKALDQKRSEIKDALERQNYGIASQALDQALVDYSEGANNDGIVSNEALVLTYILAKSFQENNFPIAAMQKCERLGCSLFPHFKTAVDILLLTDSGNIKGARNLLLEYLRDERELIFELMKTKDPEIRNKIKI